MQRFRDAIELARTKGEAHDVLALLAEDVVFRSPVVHTPYKGRAAVAPLLQAVVKVLDEFAFCRYVGERHGTDHAHVFRARIGELDIEGCDFLHLNDAGLIDEFYVMVRPLSGAIALAETMRAQLALTERQVRT